MSTFKTHVFLGPTLDLPTAKQYLPDAHYHPPIQCGDIIRLLRLAPERIILIDGLYEQVPAVWHKEIMLALDKGIEVYGAASMGALRAAELHPFGMIGIGKIFLAFLNQHLTDDDEVAVLHHDMNHHLLPINDAMVNIRETLEEAYLKEIISLSMKEVIIKLCKAQFYPNRSLQQVINALRRDLIWQEEIKGLQAWLNVHGIIDVKRNDAILALEQVQSRMLSKNEGSNKVFEMPYTKFIASLVDDTVGTPFQVCQPWFPENEKKLTLLSIKNPNEYHMVEQLAGLLKNAAAVIEPTDLLENNNAYLTYIKTQNLYFPRSLYNFLRHHPTLATLYPWMLHYTCLGNITNHRIEAYLPAAAFYWELERQSFPLHKELLSWIILLTLLLHQQIGDERLSIKRTVLKDHLQEIRFWERYKQQKRESGLHAVPNLKVTLDFVVTYMKVIYIHQGIKDFKLGLAATPSYFHWIYDALALYEQQVSLMAGS